MVGAFVFGADDYTEINCSYRDATIMIFEAEFATGLMPIVKAEIDDCIQQQGRIIGTPRSDSLQFTYDGRIDDLLSLRTVIAVYTVLQFDVPRPKALLGHENFHRLCDTIKHNLTLSDYQSLYISAAGSDSSVMVRLKNELASALDLAMADDEGDLLLRIRRTPNAKKGWDVLIRLTPRPLATRSWRVCNYEGALNASIASAIVHLTNPTPDDHFLNVTSGSGIMMIERALYGTCASVVGVDISQDALACSQQNADVAELDKLKQVQADAIQLPFRDNSFTKLVADLPFGQLIGSHDENEWLYPAILSESARVATFSARFVVITHEIKLMDAVVRQSSQWRLCEEPRKVAQSGYHPRIYVLERL